MITGATSGLGREMARQLGAEGCRLALTGRRKELLEQAAEGARAAGSPDVLVLQGGVTDPAEVRAHYAKIKERWSGLDCAILNAGVSDSVHALNFSAENYRWTFETNVFGVANWIEAVLPDMLANKSGVIAGVASLAAFRGLPHSGAYSASKAAVVTMLESTRVDLRGSGVDVVTICPGFVKSEMTDRNDIGSMPFLMTTQDGVRCMLRGIERRQRIVHFPWQLSYAAVYLLPNIPSVLYDRFAKLIKRKKKPYADPSKT